jgi:large subunit ribosomal protein L4e
MKLKILDAKNAEKGTKELPNQFAEAVRPDLIKRAVITLQLSARQPYGADPRAGKKSVAKLSRRRRDYKTGYGHGGSRIPKKTLSRSGTRMSQVGAWAPGTVGGRRAHPPKAEKILTKKINNQERRKAIRSAIAATVFKETVKARGHITPEKYPFIVSNDFESMSKTSQVEEALLALGFDKELERASLKTFRAGRPRLRGRKYKRRKGPLFVVAKECALLNSAVNIPGVDAVTVNALNAELLAPGAVPGRLTLFTEGAIERLAKENLYYENPAPKKEEAAPAKSEAKPAAKKEAKPVKAKQA